VGGADSKAPVPLASLSKAITAACIATLVRDGRLAFDTPASVALAHFAARTGGLSPRFGRVTVAQLLTHRAGFGTKKDDPGSGFGLTRYLQDHSAMDRPRPEFLAWAFRQLADEPGEKFAYSNTGYLALGLIVEQASGQRYVPYCRQAVLAPLGIAGELEPDWRVLWSFAGWRMTADDYLTLLDLFAADDGRLGKAAKQWMLDPAGKAIAAGGEAWYGLGIYMRKGAKGVNLWHFGSWANRKKSMLTLAVRQDDGTGWFVYVSPRPPKGSGAELERELLAAYRGVKRWN
jgi:CubicO group peptidase (beta-lactamase class C family)